ncbi:MAG TPA: carbohydrate ABC transporter permease [Roseiarcus sp.]|nr:carbohydrate ABC transporter permease [Roseiarcus sp.]
MTPIEPSGAAQAPPRKPSRLALTLTYAILGSWAWVCLFPLYWTAAVSLKGPLEIVGGPFYAPFFDYAPSLDAWRYVLFDSDDNPLLRFFNSAVVGLTSTALTIIVAGLAVYGLTRFRFVLPLPRLALVTAGMLLAAAAVLVSAPIARSSLAVISALALLVSVRLSGTARGAIGSNGVLIGILASRILPPVVIVLPLYVMAQRVGALDTRSILILTYTAANLPVAVWLLLPVLGSGATDLEEAAQLDGASHFRILFQVVAPTAAAGIAAAGLLIFVLCWNEYLFSVYLADDHAMTMPPFLAAQMSIREQQAGSDAEEWARLSAAIILMTAPLIACAGFAQRFLTRLSPWGRVQG